MAPAETPTAVTICRYSGNPHAQLVGTQRIQAGFALAATDLAWLPLHLAGTSYSCAAALTRTFDFLVLLQYRHGHVWVSGDTDGCSGTTNGTVFSDFGAGSDVERAYLTGRWTFSHNGQAPDACDTPPSARLGQEHQLVPGTPIRLTLCPNGNEPTRRPITTTNFQPLVAELNALRTRPSTNSCTPAGELVAFEARFSYPSGPPVVVSITKNCNPSLSNRSLDANDDGTAWRTADNIYRANH